MRSRYTIFPLFLFTLSFISGCATAPVKPPEIKERVILVNGVKYISLLDLIENTDLDYEYDTFLRSIALSNGEHSLSFFIGENCALSDGRSIMLDNPSVVERGDLLIPFDLREKVIAPWLVARRITVARPPVLNIKKVVIDAGHGGRDPGAIGKSGLREKEVALDIARYLKKELEDYGIQVVMTRSSDMFVELPKRANIANSSGADLFISVHINAHRDKRICGSEVYYLSNQVDDLRKASASRNDAFPRNQILIFASSASGDLKTIVWDVIYTGNRRESVLLAKEISRQLYPETDLQSRGVKAARFYVLNNSKIPAILVELGFISNKDEENKLKSKSFRRLIAQALAKTIVSHSSAFARR